VELEKNNLPENGATDASDASIHPRAPESRFRNRKDAFACIELGSTGLHDEQLAANFNSAHHDRC